jgi:[1-hydroxy-2-(trimethylamino)ethyl]phosphonate dioxygenase
MQRPDSINAILDLFLQRGETAYFGEPVSQIEHALQTAHLAEQSGADRALIAAALLHDVGHLVHQRAETVADEGRDAHHESHGAHWLRQLFGPEVTEPIRLHVEAKRYLCTVDADYRARLSPASEQSLQLQGGLLSPAEVQRFEQQPWFRQAVQLRRWDDEAKIVDWQVPGLQHYVGLLRSIARGDLAESNNADTDRLGQLDRN